MMVGAEAVMRELALAARRLRRRWVVTALAVATLALAMGANTAMFSVFYGLVLHPLPFPDSGALVWAQAASLRTGAVTGQVFSIPDFLDYRAQTRPIEHLSAYVPIVATLVNRGAPQHVSYVAVSGDFFAALQARPVLGRTLNRGDEKPPLPEYAVLSNGLWRARFGADPAVVGQNIVLDNRPLKIVGVMPAGFDYPQGVDLWVSKPLASDTNQKRNSRYLYVFGRLRPGMTLAVAQQQMNAIARRLAHTYPRANTDQGVKLEPMGTRVAGPMAPTLDLMMIGALLVLALACANVANLLLAAAVGRWREVALQASLGASTRRLLGQLLAEGLMLAVGAAGLGWLLALALLPLLRHAQAARLPQLAQAQLNLPVLAFSALLTLLLTLGLALAPAWEILRPQAARSLHRASAPQPRRSHLPAVLVVMEVAVTVVLLVGAGLFWQSLRRRLRADPGFHPAQVLTYRCSLLFNSYPELAAKQAFFLQVNQRLQALPGVEAAGMTSELPYVPLTYRLPLALAGTAAASSTRPTLLPTAPVLSVTPGYFQTMGIPVRGRRLTEADGAAKAQRVAIISAALAHQLLPGGDALQHTLVLFTQGKREMVRIVGVAGDVAQHTPGGIPVAEVYLPLGRLERGEMSVALRVRGDDPAALLPAVRRTMAQVDPQVPIYNVATLPDLLAQATLPARFRTELLALLAALALCLAAAGLYAVLAHNVALRRRDIGIRMALGASRRQLAAAVLMQSLRLIVAGIVLGLLLAWWLRGSLRHFLYASAAADAWTWAGVPLLVLVVSLLATLLPAHRASRVDPIVTLRCE